MFYYYLMRKISVRTKIVITVLFAVSSGLLFFLLWCAGLNTTLQERYAAAESARVSARDGTLLFLRPNANGYYCEYTAQIPENLKSLLVRKEDRFFYWHRGINQAAIIKDLASRAGFGQRRGSSTITQQLAKILLGQENQRNVNNKLRELAYTGALEISQSKDDILDQYANSIYFGNRLQGIRTASLAYFGADLASLAESQIFQLLATISDPTGLNPAQSGNIDQAKLIAGNLAIDPGTDFTDPDTVKSNLAAYYKKNIALFELRDNLSQDQCGGGQNTTIDRDINVKLREIIANDIEELDTKLAKNAAAIVIKLPENEVLALAGSPDPESSQNGYQINMLNAPRQIGSTIKPFIYLKAFEKGMRPYTLIDDREYKYAAGADFSIYPENYDRTYRGEITAHYGLANSINTAAVKTLEFVGAREFGQFIQDEMGIATQQDYENYQMGVALGAMETDLTSLAQAFTMFPNNGQIKNLKLFRDPGCNSTFTATKNLTSTKKPYTQLVNKILSDRVIAQDQFTSASYLNLEATNYALKTGTSHDYTDSWVVGYTPDFLVAVWVGNADASAMEGISGQLGAGRIWSDIMQLMQTSSYDKKTPFDFSDVIEYKIGNNLEYGLAGDNYEAARNIILKTDNQLILKPHDGDVYRLEANTRIILRAKTAATWTVNGKNLGTDKEVIYSPQAAGNYTVEAQTGATKETINITISEK